MPEDKEPAQDWREFADEIAFVNFEQGTSLVTVEADEGEIRESAYGKQVVFKTDLGLWGCRNAKMLKQLRDLRNEFGTVRGTQVEVTRLGTGRQTRYAYKLVKKPTKKMPTKKLGG